MLNKPKRSSEEIQEIERIQDLIQQGTAEGIRREVEYRRKHGLPIIVQRNGKIEDICAELNDVADHKPESP